MPHWNINMSVHVKTGLTHLNKMVDDLQGEQLVVSGLNCTAEEQANNGIKS